MGRVAVLIVLAMAVLAGCEKRPPPHFVFCDGKDGNGWNLTNTEKDANGYLIACTYTAPDRTGSYTSRCNATGCT